MAVPGAEGADLAADARVAVAAMRKRDVVDFMLMSSCGDAVGVRDVRCVATD